MNKAKYILNKSGEFIIENYNSAKPFASFFPGIAGLYGIPMWVFYVNRGQGIVSFGTEDKNHSIAEFLPATKAWQYTPLQGFRTFLKIKTKRQAAYYEPFQDTVDNLSFDIKRKMKIKSYELALEEINNTLGLGIRVAYFTMPNEPIAALVREVKIDNLGKRAIELEVVDGLPQIIPYGTSNFFLKKMGRTIEAWMRVDFLKDCIPFYNLSVDPSDKPETSFIGGGNFYLAFINKNKKPRLLKTIVDPFCLFGPGDLSYPRNFINKLKFNPLASRQVKESKTPCAFSFSGFSLSSNKSETISSVIGYVHSKDKLKPAVAKILSANFIHEKREENKGIINEIEDDVWTKSGSLEFNLYASQTYLDNALRGGYPISFDIGGEKDVFYLYSRKHGDLERDYNNFVLAPTYFSQGNGNYRDMNQNRRSDNWFNQDVLESNIANFFNLIQADGFNPLVIKGLSFIMDKGARSRLLKDVKKRSDAERINSLLSGAFSPGALSMFIEDNNIELNTSIEEFLHKALFLSQKVEEADHCEGFWTDHWTYNLDLIENYLALYPEKLKELLIDKKIFTFFDNTEVVRPRAEKYVITCEGKIRQYHSIGRDMEKEELIAKRATNKDKARFNFGKGEIIHVNLLTKLICLFVNKLASLDSFGVGIEMEANKPNWFDSLNGLPALFGSSINETFELKRLILFIEGALKSSGAFRRSDVLFPVEIHDFLKELGKLLKEYFASDSQSRDFIFWDKAYSAKENYRKLTKLGFSGKEAGIDLTSLFSILDAAERKVSLGIKRALDKKTNLYHTYFINEVVDYEKTDSGIKARKFKQVPLPLFLEGQMHALRIERDRGNAAVLYKAARMSPLYDKKLKMYKVCASLKEAPVEIGRCRIFSPGWLENESIWLHMEYKFLFELLRSGLYDEFYRDFFNCFVSFLNPSRYGRSILENSSFLVSSVFSDSNLHGTGFVARLSGSTAEFVSIWRVINTGFNPFRIDKQGRLNLKFEPILHKSLFTKQKTYSFKFLNKVIVTYHASKRANTFGSKGNSVKMYILKDESGGIVNIDSNIISHPYAEKVRSGNIAGIDAYLA